MESNLERFDARYRKEAEFVGGESVVTKAYDTLVGRFVAIKTPSDIVMRTPKRLQRFVEEARLMGQLKNDHIIEILHFYERGEVDDRYHLIMEWLDENLENIVSRSDISWEVKYGIFCRVLDGVKYLHSKGIVHRDLKPANILLDADLRVVKIADLGIATVSSGDGTARATFKYSAPEVFREAATDDKRLDIYSLGFTFFEVFAGSRGFRESLPEIFVGAEGASTDNRWLNWHLNAERRLPSLSNIDPHIPTAISDVISRMAEKDASRRFQTIEEVQLALSAMSPSSGEGVAQPMDPRDFDARQKGPKGAEPERKSRLTLGRLLMYTGIGLIGAAALILLLPSHKSPPVVPPASTHAETPAPAPVAKSEGGENQEVARRVTSLDALIKRARYLGLDPDNAGFIASRAALASAAAKSDPADAPHIVQSLDAAIEGLSAALATGARVFTIGTESAAVTQALRLCQTMRQHCDAAMFADEAPHTVSLKPFAIDSTEVTNREFAEFVTRSQYITGAESAHGLREVVAGHARFKQGLTWRTLASSGSAHTMVNDLPVRGMNYFDATAYCQAAGKRLPLESEWEMAARGPERRVFSWGDDPTAGSGTSELKLAMDHPAVPPLGARGMGESLWEWVDGGSESQRVLRGASWLENNLINRRLAARRLEQPAKADVDDGFRCAQRTEIWPTDVTANPTK
jgi:serine/threonine protein kinase/formylglycine-generating enzyme required for sulfatase activity